MVFEIFFSSNAPGLYYLNDTKIFINVFNKYILYYILQVNRVTSDEVAPALI